MIASAVLASRKRKFAFLNCDVTFNERGRQIAMHVFACKI